MSAHTQIEALAFAAQFNELCIVPPPGSFGPGDLVFCVVAPGRIIPSPHPWVLREKVPYDTPGMLSLSYTRGWKGHAPTNRQVFIGGKFSRADIGLLLSALCANPRGFFPSSLGLPEAHTRPMAKALSRFHAPLHLGWPKRQRATHDWDEIRPLALQYIQSGKYK